VQWCGFDGMATSSNQVSSPERGARVLVIAALGRELAALRRESHPRVALLETGEGTTKAGQAARSWLDAETPQAVLGLGFAGALSRSLDVGDLLVARECRTSGGDSVATTPTMLEAARRIQANGLAVRFGVTLTVDQVVCQAEGKRKLAMTLAPDEIACVDMESSAIARACAERGVPFLIVRCVSDLFAEDLPVDFNRCREADGQINNWKVIASAIGRPSSIKGLLELRKRAMNCSEKLADFVRRLLSEID
jgi:adenosylhomocysteine nucleosidase